MNQFEFPPDHEPVQVPQEEVHDLPIQFCVKTVMGNRNGYFFLRWSHGGLDTNNKIIHVIKQANHQNRYYQICDRNANITAQSIISRKGQGNLTREIRWWHTDKEIRYGDSRIPVIRVSRRDALPTIKPISFIPLINVPTPTPVPVPTPKRYTITSIPQHTILALLRDAAMQEEVCPITSEEIDVTNGAVTSCFHLFEKNAIMQWLLTQNSQQKCPVCNSQCNSYTLDEPPSLGN